MKITVFAKKVAKREVGKKQVNIAQIMEILKVVNTLTEGSLYKVIRGLK